MKIAAIALFALLAQAAGLDPAQFAPVLRLHSKEKFRPADPAAVFLAAVPSSLAPEFAIRIVPATAKATWLWQRSGSRITDLLPPHSHWDLIDYWYFVPYNEAGLWFGLGDHEGDWEGMAVLFCEGEPVAAYYSQHDGGRWYCAGELEKDKSGRFMVYSALGSHASFPHPGEYRRGLFFLGIDLADAGALIPMEVRPLANEPYLNFEGRWGKESFIPGSRGPLSPHPERKFLPRKFEVKDADWLKKNCLRDPR